MKFHGDGGEKGTVATGNGDENTNYRRVLLFISLVVMIEISSGGVISTVVYGLRLWQSRVDGGGSGGTGASEHSSTWGNDRIRQDYATAQHPLPHLCR